MYKRKATKISIASLIIKLDNTLAYLKEYEHKIDSGNHKAVDYLIIEIKAMRIYLQGKLTTYRINRYLRLLEARDQIEHRDVIEGYFAAASDTEIPNLLH